MTPELIHWQLDILDALGIDHPIAQAWRADAHRVLEYAALREKIRGLGASERLIELLDAGAAVDTMRQLFEMTPTQVAELNAAIEETR